MEAQHFLGMNISQHANTMLYSRIQPDLYQKSIQNQYIIHKLAKADKQNFQKYLIRATISHPHVAHVFVQSKSPFYHTIYIEKLTKFTIKDLIILPINKRIMVLTEVLSAVKVLANVYGFFYITEKMLGYSSTGKITLWIHENLIENKRSYPINHQKFSEDIFVSDFKDGFGGNLRELRQFQKTKTVDSLITLLSKRSSIAHSIYVSEPAYKGSRIYRKHSQISASELNCRESCNMSDNGNRDKPFKFNFNSGLKKTGSLSALRKPISFSYLPSQLEKSIIQSSKILPERVLSSSQNLQFRHPEHRNRFNTSNSSLNFSKVLHNSSSLQNLSRSILPKIQFNYQNPVSNDIWKKKPNTFSKADAISSQGLLRSQSLRGVGFQTRQTSKQPLKASFPHTTTHTFLPLASNGNISLSFKDSSNLQRKGIKFVRQDSHELDNKDEQHISEDSNEVEMDLDILFSDDEQLHSRQQELEMIMEQFENVLLS